MRPCPDCAAAGGLFGISHLGKYGFLRRMTGDHYKMDCASLLKQRRLRTLVCATAALWICWKVGFMTWLTGWPLDIVLLPLWFMLASYINNVMYHARYMTFADPRSLLFSQDSISRRFRDGSLVAGPLRTAQPYVAAVCVHSREGFYHAYALNNLTLFNAAYNGIEEVRVLIVDPPGDWNARFTNVHFGTCIRLRGEEPQHVHQAVRIPLASQSSDESRQTCFVVLEARNLINPQKSDTLLTLLKDFSADIKLEEVPGARSYARVRVDCQDAELVTNIIKAIGEQRGKTVEVREVESERRYASPPRD